MDTESPPAVPRPAASVLLLRDSPNGIEVFMATRHQGSSFMPGVLVFPGGAVDAEDADLAPANGPEDAVSRIAGIREVFEEAGFLLARAKGQDNLVPPVRFADLLHRYRASLAAGEGSFAAMLAVEGLVPATDLMVPFARWITPVIRKKRFDARFFLARAPEGQIGAHDDQELINSRWIGAAEALDAVKRGEVKIVFVTRSNLGLLAKSRTVEEALAAARARPIVPVEPQLFDHADGPALRIPADAGYDITEILVRDVGD
ncbi:MAG TPA: NUDIX hydrolase [Alphaproteobacteria bacterium]|nr:NUDIX hydrolase [Alphaproteobacteria bacterium]